MENGIAIEKIEKLLPHSRRPAVIKTVLHAIKHNTSYPLDIIEDEL